MPNLLVTIKIEYGPATATAEQLVEFTTAAQRFADPTVFRDKDGDPEGPEFSFGPGCITASWKTYISG